MSTQFSKRELISKSALSAGMGVGALALLTQTQRASADTPFTSFPFTATGAVTARTMPDRLAEIKNVKDYGAKGNGATDDTAAIQAAVNNANAPYSIANRGIIFFPAGTYLLSSPVTFELSDGITSIAFVGAPGAKLIGSFADALLKRSPNSPVGGAYLIQNLIFENANAAGKCIMFHSIAGGKIVACQFNGHGGTVIETYNSQSVTIDSCSMIAGATGTGIGVMAGNATTIIACDITAMAEGIRHYNSGLVILGGRLEVNTIGINLGVDQNGVGNQSAGVKISAISMESNTTGIRVGACSSLDVSAIGVSAAQTGIAYGIVVYGGDHMSFRGITVSSIHGWSGAAIALQGGNTITMDSCACGTSNWNVVSTVDVQFTNCDAPMPTLAQLPPASGVARNTRRYISDADASYLVYGSIAVGGGTNGAPVWTDGKSWRYG